MPSFKLLVLIPFLSGMEKGHDYVYNRSVEKAAAINQWGHAAAIPVSIKDDGLPKEWERILPSHRLLYQKNPVSRFNRLIRNCTGIRHFIRRQTSSCNSAILIESFDPSFLLALVIALAFIRGKRPEIWLLYRSEKSCKGLKGLAHRLLLRMISFFSAPGRPKILTDSRLLADWFAPFFHQPIHVVPIPHTHRTLPPSSPPKRNRIVCWMPGRQIEEPYNRSIILHLCRLTCPEKMRLLLVLGQGSGLKPAEGGVDILRIPAFLSLEEYRKWMEACDVVLLPYDPTLYRRSTSGVFVECVCAGKIPLVSRETWMAAELSRFALSDLAVDWFGVNILSEIERVVGSEKVSKKLQQMRKTYLEFHDEMCFAKHLQKIAAGLGVT